MLTYPGTITLPASTLTFLADLLQAYRARLRTWRKLPARDQALLVLAHLRNGDTYARLAAGFGIGVATAYCYVREAVALLAGLGRGLTAALWALAWTHSNFAVRDGTIVRTNRLRAHDRRYYSGRHRHHGVNLPGLTDPHGRLVWIFDGLPGSPTTCPPPAPTACSPSPPAPSFTSTPTKAIWVVQESLCLPRTRGETCRTPTGRPTAAMPLSAPTPNAASRS